MTPIEWAAEQAMDRKWFARNIVTAFLDAILADPEAMERVREAALEIMRAGNKSTPSFIEALKQEAGK